jgi:hypothetical protein
MQAAPDRPIVIFGKVETVDTKNGECGATQTGPPVFSYSLNEQPKIHARYGLTCCTVRAAVGFRHPSPGYPESVSATTAPAIAST